MTRRRTLEDSSGVALRRTNGDDGEKEEVDWIASQARNDEGDERRKSSFRRMGDYVKETRRTMATKASARLRYNKQYEVI